MLSDIDDVVTDDDCDDDKVSDAVEPEPDSEDDEDDPLLSLFLRPISRLLRDDDGDFT